MARGGVVRVSRETGDWALIVEPVVGGPGTHQESDPADLLRPSSAHSRNRSTSRILVLFLVLVLAALAPRPADAKYAAIVVDAQTGHVYHEFNADERNYPASLTKLMTLYLLFEAIENKRISWQTPLTASRHAARQPATRLGLNPGDKITAKEATLALIIHSANDVAVAVGEALAGSEEKFALQMTAKARKLGMTRTTFRNASGLPHSGQQSTARDMAVLAEALMSRFPQYYKLFGETAFTYNGRVYKTHNHVLLDFDGADGLKTGYTHASGFNLVSSAVRDGHRLIGVVFGGNTSRSRDHQMESLLDKAFAQIDSRPTTTARAQRAPQRRTSQPAAPPVEVNSSDDTPDVAMGDGGERGEWGIQVGAFYTKEPARTIAHEVAQKYAKFLDGGEIAVVPLSKAKGKVLYRARILGLERTTAYQVCKLLKRAKRPCMELKEQGSQEVAERH